jgi:iron uptake system component EfeO
LAAAGLLVGAAAMLGACGSSGSGGSAGQSGDGAKPLKVVLTDQGCGSVDLHANAGDISFEVTNKAKTTGEFEVISPGPHLVAEREGIPAGDTVTLKARVTKGVHQLVCTTPAKDRGKLTVTGEGGGLDPKVTAALQPATTSYKAYAVQEVDALLAGTQQFVAAVKAGNRDQAKALYATTRVHYERLEPIAELFPDLDAAIDARADDFGQKEQDPKWTGWHRLEYGLWDNQPMPSLSGQADKLLSDTTALVAKIKTLTIDPSVVAKGAAGLIEEAAQTKVTGEEERYSHTDVATLVANVDGAEKIIDLLTPALGDVKDGPALLQQLKEDFASLTAVTDRMKDAADPSGYQPYDKVSDNDRASLKAGLSDLSEELATVPGLLGLAVS